MSLYSIQTIKLASARRLVLFISSLLCVFICRARTFSLHAANFAISSIPVYCLLDRFCSVSVY